MADERTVKEYLEFMEKHSKYYRSDRIQYVRDPKTLMEFRSSDGRTVGVKHTGPFSNFVVDLIIDQSGKMFTFERLIPTNDGGVVIVTRYGSKYLMIKQYRHLIDEVQLSFPKGCGEPGVDPRDNAVDELREEIGCKDPKVRYHGRISPDCGITSNQIHVLSCDIEDYSIPIGYEDIEGYVLLEADELEGMIRSGEITDAVSISAYMMAKDP